MKLNAIAIEPPEPATASIIWLHGLGANGHDFEPIVPELPASLTRCTRFIFPHAPNRPISINMGMVMPGWYDIAEVDLTARQDVEGIYESDQLLRAYLQREVEQGIPTERIVVAGFSQGGAIALHTSLRYPQKLAGILALSTYLPLADTVAAEIHPANRQTPIFYGHGQLDPVIWFPQANHSRVQLEQLGYAVEWHAYVMQHAVCPQEIADIGRWLKARLPPV